MIHLLLELVNEVMVWQLNWIAGLRFNIWFGKTLCRLLEINFVKWVVGMFAPCFGMPQTSCVLYTKQVTRGVVQHMLGPC